METNVDCYLGKSPQVDDLLDTLSHNLRREVINYFETGTEDTTAAVETVLGFIHQRVPEDSLQELEIELRHVHLPKLEQRGWIERDGRSDTIRYHGHENAEPYLRELIAVFRE